MKKIFALASMVLGLLLLGGCFTIQYVENPYTSDKTTVGVTRDLDAVNIPESEAKNITDSIVKELEKEQAFDFIDKRPMKNNLIHEIYKELQVNTDVKNADQIKRKIINLKYMLVGNVVKSGNNYTIALSIYDLDIVKFVAGSTFCYSSNADLPGTIETLVIYVKEKIMEYNQTPSEKQYTSPDAQ